MFFALPSPEQSEDFFKRLRALLFGVFEVLLLVLAMAAIIALALSHVPKLAG